VTEALWQRHEREVAALLHGQVTIGSGNSFEKLDIQKERDGSWWRALAECKCTQKLGYRVTAKLWNEVRERVYERSAEMRPAMAIRLYGDGGGRGQAPVVADLFILDLNDAAELFDERERLAARVAELEGRCGPD
jgi:hypothetical protein